MLSVDHVLWNDQMDTVSNLVIWINLLSAFAAFVVNIKASITNPEPWKKIRFLIGCYALIYAFCYGWLLASEDLIQWSSTMRGVSVIAWPLVWIAPAWVSSKVWRDVKETIKRQKDTKDES